MGRTCRFQPPNMVSVDLCLRLSIVCEAIGDQDLDVRIHYRDVDMPSGVPRQIGQSLVVSQGRRGPDAPDETKMRHYPKEMLAALSGSSSSKQRW